MTVFVLVPHYLAWHYTRALREGAELVSNLLWFATHFFSIPTLVRTWFSPWRRMAESYSGGLNIEAWFSTMIVNTLTRFVGFLMRSVLIFLGVASWIFIYIGAIVALLFWLVLPILIPFAVAVSVLSLSV